MQTCRNILAVLSITFLACLQTAFAEDGQPLAIRHWPGDGFTIETMWGLDIGMNVSEEVAKTLPRPLAATTTKKKSVVKVSRAANSSDVDVEEVADGNFDPVEFLSFGVKVVSNTTGDGGCTVQADGGYVLNFNGVEPEKIAAEMGRLEANKDAFFKSIGGKEKWRCCVIATDESFDEKLLKRVTEITGAEIVVVNAAIKQVGDVFVENVPHNTVAFSATGDRRDVRIVSLGTEPYQMSDEVADMFTKKEAAQKMTRELFASLSTEEMNFKPSNGTHTPRWNAEHMMGCELVFFSQIYNAVDPTIPVMELRPKQMPKDYEFAHADWTGEEEARQLKRVENFTRRFAYLLEGMDLNKKAKGSRIWSPRSLLLQMDRHYNEHSGNVRKKMKLSDWPKPETTKTKD